LSFYFKKTVLLGGLFKKNQSLESNQKLNRHIYFLTRKGVHYKRMQIIIELINIKVSAQIKSLLANLLFNNIG
jgi:hypothetical protein